MLGLGTLLLGGVLLGSAIKCGIENDKMMSKPQRYLDDGTPVYLDRLCNEHVNGEKIVPRYNYQQEKLVYVGEKSGRVYSDPEQNTKNRLDSWNEERKQEAIKLGKLAYMKYDHVRKHQFTCEISTDKFICYLEGRKDGTYWKYYLPIDTPYDKAHMKGEGNIGIQITQEEFDKLNIFGGTHWYVDYYRGIYHR